MNRRWTIPACVALAAGALAFALTRHAVRGRSENTLDCLQDLTTLTRELNLIDAQARDIKALHAALGAKLYDSCARHCAARARLGQVLASPTNSDAQVGAVLAEMCRAYEESERATLDHIRQVRAVLTADQRKRFDVMIAKHMCRNCTMPGGKKTSARPASKALGSGISVSARYEARSVQ